MGEVVRLADVFAAGVQEDPARLAVFEQRRDVIQRLGQKHGGGIAEVLEVRRRAGEELELLDTADVDLRAIAARRSAAAAALVAAAAALTARRRVGAVRLARAVNRLLPRLGLPGGRLSVAVEPLAEPGRWGSERVGFVVRLNPGLEPRPLARSASGGELSRIMLALKVVLVRHDAIATLVFDEVDQGIGGEVGGQVGEALAAVAARRQVLVITHLPQIASCADHHLVVSKAARGGVATSDVRTVHGEDRIDELARMLGDPESEAARRHAAALLARDGRVRSA